MIADQWFLSGARCEALRKVSYSDMSSRISQCLKTNREPGGKLVGGMHESGVANMPNESFNFPVSFLALCFSATRQR